MIQQRNEQDGAADVNCTGALWHEVLCRCALHSMLSDLWIAIRAEVQSEL